jgi:hypothetical protein
MARTIVSLRRPVMAALIVMTILAGSRLCRICSWTPSKEIWLVEGDRTLGFSVLALSDVTQVVKFGALAGFAFTWALLADLLFAPALLMLVKPLAARR